MNKIILITCSTIILATGCKKDDDASPPTGSSQPASAYGLTLASRPSIAMTQGGNDTTYFADSTGWVTMSASGSLNGDRAIASGLIYGLTSDYWMVTFLISGDTVPPANLFQAAFSTGAHAYDANDEAPSVQIRANGAGYAFDTQCNGGTQNGSSLNILARQFVAGSPDTMKVLATFNCDLHDCGSNTTLPDVQGAIRLNFLRE